MPSVRGSSALGVKDDTVIIFSELMGSESLFLTANADTVYFVSFIDLSSGPMVVETPPQALAIFDDMAFNWMVDFGLPGPDRGEGGRFLLLPPGYNGDLPDSGFHLGRARTERALALGRAFMQDSDPKPTADLIKRTMMIYPYTSGGTGRRSRPCWKARSSPARPRRSPRPSFVEGSGKAFATIPFTDARFFDQVNEMVQQEPLGYLDPRSWGSSRRSGSSRGEVRPRPRGCARSSKKRPRSATAMSRTLMFDSRGMEYYPGSAWTAMLFVGGYNFETPPPMVTSEGSSPSRLPDRGSCTRARRSSTDTPGSRPRCACG